MDDAPVPGTRGTGHVLSSGAARSTSGPAATKPRASRSTTASIPPYAAGGTGSQAGAIRPIRTDSPFRSAHTRGRPQERPPKERGAPKQGASTVHPSRLFRVIGSLTYLGGLSSYGCLSARQLAGIAPGPRVRVWSRVGACSLFRGGR